MNMQYKAAETWGSSAIYYYNMPPPPPPSSLQLQLQLQAPPPQPPQSMLVTDEAMERVVRMASESAVVIFSSSSNCCMCHAVKSLFCSMGVSPSVHELDSDPRGREIEKALLRLLLLFGKYSSTSITTHGFSVNNPVVFVGGKLVGAMDSVMASHINGSLVPLLKQAGALWL